MPRKEEIMKAIKRKVFTLTLCILMMFVMSPTTTLAANQPHPTCNHSMLSYPNGTTMYNTNRKSYKYNYYGEYVLGTRYRCSLCGYEVWLED